MREMRRKKWDNQEINDAIKMYHDGKTFASIGRELGRSTGSVKIKLNKLGYTKVNKEYYRKNMIYLWDILEIRKNIIDIEEAKTTAHQSNKKLLFKCSTDNCDYTKRMTPCKLFRNGFSCPNCSSNISYPEKFMLAVNRYFNLGMEYQKRLPELNLIFDFVDYSNKIVYEMQGLQHYEETTFFGGEKEFKRIKDSDNNKRLYCEKAGWIYIEIDARYSDFHFIKNNINKCKYLPNISCDIEKNIIKLIEESSIYDIEKLIKLYNVDKLTTYQIAEQLGVSQGTVCTLLDRNNIKRDNNKRSVRCVETGDIYNSLCEATRKTGIASSHISSCCKGNRKTTGGYHWEYVE